MRTKITSFNWVALALVTAAITMSSDASGQQPAEKPAAAGPPAWVLEAWETGEAPAPPAYGPPAWVVEAWQSGEQPSRPMGPRPWVVARQEFAKEIGLPGPPVEVLEAWENGEGFSLPGPPDFQRVVGSAGMRGPGGSNHTLMDGRLLLAAAVVHQQYTETALSGVACRWRGKRASSTVL